MRLDNTTVSIGLACAGSKRAYEAAGACEALTHCADELDAVLIALRGAHEPETDWHLEIQHLRDWGVSVVFTTSEMQHGREYMGLAWLQGVGERIRDTAQALLLKVSALSGSPNWRDIETAPKDGRFILLLGRNQEFPDVGRWFDAGKNEQGFFAVHAVRWEPTHWMPLPSLSTIGAGAVRT